MNPALVRFDIESTDAPPEEWSILRQWLPAGLGQLAREQGFFARRRGLQDADLWLRLILMHVAGGLSLKQTVVRAREAGWAQVSLCTSGSRKPRRGRPAAALGKRHFISIPSLFFKFVLAAGTPKRI